MTEASSPYIIRPMEPGDIPAVVAIDRLSFPTPWPVSSYLYELTHSRSSFYHVLLRAINDTTDPRGRGWRSLLRDVARQPDANHLTGYVGLRLHDVEAHISTIAVHPDWRGRGLGELLLLTTMEHALELQAHLVTLEVRASNQVAQHLYHKYGFKFTGTHRGYYRDGEDAWLMAVEVTNNGYQPRLAELRLTLEERLWCQAPPASQEEVGQNDRLAL